MTRREIEHRLAQLATELTTAPDHDPKQAAVANALKALRKAVAFRTEQEFAELCATFDPLAVLARLDADARERRKSTGSLLSPTVPGGEPIERLG